MIARMMTTRHSNDDCNAVTSLNLLFHKKIGCSTSGSDDTATTTSSNNNNNNNGK